MIRYVVSVDEPPQRPTSPFQRPLGVLESLVASLKVYVSNANTLLLIAAIFVIPVTILTVLIIRLSFHDLATIDPNSQNPFEGLTRSEVAKVIGAFLIGTVINLVISMVAIGACFKAIHDALSGTRPDWRNSIRAALDKVRSLVWLPILIGLLFLGGLVVAIVLVALLGTLNEQLGTLVGLALLVGVIYVFVAWSVAMPVLMAEDRRGLDAVSRSQQLVKGEWWPTFGVYALAFLLLAIVSSILSAIFNVGGRTGDEGLILTTLYGVVTNVLFTPFQAALVGVVYLNLALKKHEVPG
jgi:hypothetical protein